MIPILRNDDSWFGSIPHRQIKPVILDYDSKKLSRELVDLLRTPDTYNGLSTFIPIAK